MGKDPGNLSQRYIGPLLCDTVTNLDTLENYFWKITAKSKSGKPLQSVGSFITRYSPPHILSQTQDTIISKGDIATIRITATGHSLHFQWQCNNKPIPNATTPVLKLAPAGLDDNKTRYQCIVYNSVGADTSRLVTATIKP
jgi:hypothetical protein